MPRYSLFRLTRTGKRKFAILPTEDCQSYSILVVYLSILVCRYNYYIKTIIIFCRSFINMIKISFTVHCIYSVNVSEASQCFCLLVAIARDRRHLPPVVPTCLDDSGVYSLDARYLKK